MNKTEWIKEANDALNKQTNASCNINNWIEILLDSEEIPEVTISLRTGNKSLKDILRIILHNANSLAEAHQEMGSLAKGLLYHVPEDAVIHRISLHE
jgi:hypothetical protein